MKKIFVSSLPVDTTENSLVELFSAYGTVRSLNLAKDLFSGKCKGFGFIEMEGHEARAAIAGLNGKTYRGRTLSVKLEHNKKAHRGRRR